MSLLFIIIGVILMTVGATSWFHCWKNDTAVKGWITPVIAIGLVTVIAAFAGSVANETTPTKTVSGNTVAAEVTGDVAVAEVPEVNSDSTAKYATIVSDNKSSNSTTFKLMSGEEVTYYIPEGHYNTTAEFYDSMESTNGYVDRTAPWFSTGSAETLFGSEQAINCAPMSALIPLTTDDRTLEPDFESIGSTAYKYMLTGELSPDESELNYNLNELDSIVVGDIIYRVFEVSYSNSVETEDAEGNPTTSEFSVKRLEAYSSTEDPVEIDVYTGEYNAEVALDLLHKFLGTK